MLNSVLPPAHVDVQVVALVFQDVLDDAVDVEGFVLAVNYFDFHAQLASRTRATMAGPLAAERMAEVAHTR